MERNYTRSEVRRNRRMIRKWSMRLFFSGLACAYMFVCTGEGHELPWLLLILGVLMVIAGLFGMWILDATSKPREWYECYY